MEILVVDDDDLIVHGISRVLRRAGHSVHGCTSGREAVSIANNLRHLDVVLSDLHLGPDTRGTEIISTVRSRHPQAAAILLSGDVPEEIAPDCVVLQKPVTTELLLDACARRAR